MGLFALWQKDDKVWIEIAPDQFDKPFFFKSNLNQRHRREPHLRRPMTYPSASSRSSSSTRSATSCSSSRRTPSTRRRPERPRRARSPTAFSDSLLATAPLASQPHPERKSILSRRTRCCSPTCRGGRDARARLPAAVRVRRAQLVARAGSRAHADHVVVRRHRALRARARDPAAAAADTAARCRRRRRRSRTCAACSSAITTASRSCPTRRCAPRVADDRVGHFTTDRLDFTDRRAARRRCSTTSIAGASRRRTRPRRCPSRSSRSSSGSTATFRRSTATTIARRHPRMEQGVRAHRLQGRDPRRAAARRRRLRHLGRRATRRCAGMTIARSRRTARSARRSSIRAPARSSTPTSAIDANDLRIARNLRARVGSRRFAARRAVASGVAARRAHAACSSELRGAGERRSRLSLLEARGDIEPDSPEADAFVNGVPEGHRRCTRSATRSGCGTTSARRRSTREAQLADRDSRASTASPAR